MITSLENKQKFKLYINFIGSIPSVNMYITLHGHLSKHSNWEPPRYLIYSQISNTSGHPLNAKYFIIMCCILVGLDGGLTHKITAIYIFNNNI